MDNPESITVDVNYRPSPGLEDLRYYCKGGYHPVHIGDVFNGRYRVVNKLGYGSYGTVWLVEDLLLKRFASLKVLTARTSAISSEMRVVQHLKTQQERDEDHPGREHVMQIFDAFTIHGPNGTHHCIVAELLGISLEKEEYALCLLHGFDADGHLPVKAKKKMAAQVALGVAYLHKCGIIHGDLNLGNILFFSSKFQTASLSELNRIYGQLVPLGIENPSVHMPRTAFFANYDNSLLKLCLSKASKIHVKLCDFRESYLYEPQPHIEKPLRFYMPLILQPPEIIFNDTNAPTFSIDIWSLGVLIYMFINWNNPPFYIPYSPNGGVVDKMVMLLGKPPEKWWTRWADRSKYYDDDGVHLKTKMQAGAGRTIRLAAGYGISKKESSALTEMLQKIFLYNPTERIDAEEVLRFVPDNWKKSRSHRNWNWKTWKFSTQAPFLILYPLSHVYPNQ